ncbi:S66 family peptidase [Halorarum halobium]|uniref:S66 family peptidase n=1 Tax=Halorarum halobium TaxID=3075121 RepID=UPI0028AA67FF|nr:LD-carboxypeptidase [Halobaculum sp. XH14]
MEHTRPPALSSGDTVAILAPSRPIPDELIDVAERRLAGRFDLDVVSYPTADRDPADGPAPPAERAEELMGAFEDPDVGAVLAATGGDDQLRVLKHLDPERLRSNPTRFLGYSDNDNLRLLLWTLGQVSWGATALPDLVVDPELHPYTARYLDRALFDDALGPVEPAAEWTDDWYDFESGESRDWHDAPDWTWRDRGTVSGPTWGGCLAIVGWHLQTERYLPEPEHLDGAVLALETSETLPDPDEVGYLLRSLGERGWLERFAGVLVARPQANNPTLDYSREFDEYRANVRAAVNRELDRYCEDATAAFDVDFGHTSPIFPLPLGATATLDPEAATVRFD